MAEDDPSNRPWWSTARAYFLSVMPHIYILLQNKCDINPWIECLCLKYKHILYYFMKESLNFCVPGMHPIEIHYNSFFIYANLIYAGISRNLILE
jgi:hypothetical protein